MPYGATNLYLNCSPCTEAPSHKKKESESKNFLRGVVKGGGGGVLYTGYLNNGAKSYL